MLKMKLLICVLLITNARTTDPERGEASGTRDEIGNLKWRHETREKIAESLIEFSQFQTEFFNSPAENVSFDLCDPEIDRSLLCEAINIRMNKKTRRIIDEPCLDLETAERYFMCTTEDAIELKVRTLPMENKIFLKTEGETYNVFMVPPSIHSLLVNPYYSRYNSLATWISENKPTSEEISSKIEETDLPTAYRLALQLNIFGIRQLFERSVEPQGPAICSEFFNRGVYCEAVNIRMYGHSFPITDIPCGINSSGSYYLCKMANGETLFMERGNYKTEVYLTNYENEVVYVVESAPIHASFINKYMLQTHGTKEQKMRDWAQMIQTSRTWNFTESPVGGLMTETHREGP